MKRILTLTVTACCAYLFLACGSSGGSTPSDVVKEFYKAINAENYEAAVDCMYFDNPSDRSMLLEMLKEYMGPEMKKLGGMTPSNFTEQPAKQEGEIDVKFDLTNGKGQTEPDHAVCLRDAEGKWKMRPIN